MKQRPLCGLCFFRGCCLISQKPWKQCALLLLVTAAIFAPGLRGGFIFDDFPNLVEDPDWKVTSLSWQEWWRATALGISSNIGRPLALLSFSINYYLTGLDPFWLKLTSLCMHLFNVVLVFVLCQRLFDLVAAPSAKGRLGRFAALLIALAWALHPLQVSTVLYVVQRMEVGASTGVLLGLLAYIRARKEQLAERKSWPWWLLACLATLGGLGFKETALLVPGFAFLVELWVLRFSDGHGVDRRLQAIYVVGLLIAALVFILGVLPVTMHPEAYSGREFTLGQRLLTQPHVLLTYLGQMVFPLPSQLAFYYDNFPISKSLLSPSSTLAGLLMLVIMAVGAWLTRLRLPLVAFGITWFFMGHVLTSNVWPLELAFEHRNYLALLGVLIAVSQVLAVLAAPLSRGARQILSVSLVLFLAILCALQVNTWADPLRLAMSLAARNPESARASYELAKNMLILAGGDRDSPLWDIGLRQLAHASSLPSRSPLAEQGLIIVSARLGRTVPHATWARFRGKLAAGPAGAEQISALYGVLECRVRVGPCQLDDRELFQTIIVALERNPTSAVVHSLYANFAWGVMGDRDLAIAMMREATRLAPEDLRFQVNLAQYLSVAGNNSAELEALRERITSADKTGSFRDEMHEITGEE